MIDSDEVKRIRKSAGLSVEAAAKVVRVHPTSWRRWETAEVSGRHMPQIYYEMFLLLTEQHWNFHLAPGPGKNY